MSQEAQELRDEIARLRAELDRAVQERRRLSMLLHQQPDLKKLEETQGLLQAAETARQAGEERNLELLRLLSQASQRQQQLEDDLARQQESYHKQLAELQATLATLQQERDELYRQAEANAQPGNSEIIRKLHGQLRQLHQQSKEKLESLAEELRRRHRIWEQETLHKKQLQWSFDNQIQAFSEEIAQLKQSLKTAQYDLQDHEFALETNEEQISWLEGEIEEREEIIESMRGQISIYLEKLRTAQVKLNEAGQALQQRNSLLKQFQEQRLMLVSQCRAWEASYKKAEDEKNRLLHEVSELKTRLEDVEWELEETQVSLEDSQHLVASLQDQVFQQLPEAHRRLREAEARARSLESTLEDLPAVKDSDLM